MKCMSLFTALVALGILFFCSSDYRTKSSPINSKDDTVVVRNDLQKHFKDCNVNGTIVIFDNNKQQWIVSDTIGAKMETLPASTFKILNLLVALETDVIADENELVQWAGRKDTAEYGYRPEIYHDMTVKEAFDVSAVWAFIELAKRIGKDNYKKYLTSCNYGNLNLSHQGDDFWNFGALGISPVNQVQFVRKLYENKLPFSREHMEIVKRVMVVEQKDGYVIHAKTGWTSKNGINIGWWVGYLEKNKTVYFFATRLLQDEISNNPNFGTCRKEITMTVFRDLGIID